ncbi:MAG: NFACT RNA binding domain-containing protein [Cyclobacteriaceae bacterium]
MHNNFYFLRQLSTALDRKLKGYSVVSCFSQNKDELIIELNNEVTSFFIKAHLHSFSCLAFPDHFNRARKNSIDLFDEIILKKFIGVTQFENERSFALNFEKGYALIFKMHANRANVLLAKDQQVIQIFRNQFSADSDLSFSGLHRTIDWSKKCFLENRNNLKEVYPTLGKIVWSYLDEKGFNIENHDKSWILLNGTLELLQQPTFYLIKQNAQIKLSLLEYGEVLKKFSDPIEAINAYFFLFTSTEGLQKEKLMLQKQLTSTMDSCQNYILKNQKKLEEITIDTQYKTWADVLMANIHRVERGNKKVELEDFNGNKIVIKLKPELNAQQNAQIFYRKAKNQEIEIKKLTTSIEAKKGEVERARRQLDLLNTITTLEEFRNHFKSTQSKVTKKSEPVPFHTVEHMGYQIWIGKNSVNNDLLTLKYAHKDDVWLHAKDVSGSHVVIKNQSGKTIPKEVIERAAELAAYNSKRKTESLCPVAYTFKKFVRKRKGDPAGAVVVEREEVIMVTPKLIS